MMQTVFDIEQMVHDLLVGYVTITGKLFKGEKPLGLDASKSHVQVIYKNTDGGEPIQQSTAHVNIYVPNITRAMDQGDAVLPDTSAMASITLEVVGRLNDLWAGDTNIHITGTNLEREGDTFYTNIVLHINSLII